MCASMPTEACVELRPALYSDAKHNGRARGEKHQGIQRG